MRRDIATVIAGMVLIGAGCAAAPRPPDLPLSTRSNGERPSISAIDAPAMPAIVASAVMLPLDGSVAGYRPTYKRFGEEFADRFRGYHIGEDAETQSEDLGPGEAQEVPVRAIADGTVRHAAWVRGYGGVVVVAHTIGTERVSALYGHLDTESVRFAEGAAVRRGDVIGVLGAGGTTETDGERQHLHFALYVGDALRLSGYERSARAVRTWINPHDFFVRHGVDRSGLPTAYSTLEDPQGKHVFRIDFTIPDGWDVEYIPSIQALNLYAVSGEGTARERSQVLIRYFDASDFLTLSTVNVFEATDRTVGQENYAARRYVIEKKAGVPNFADQPSWRNVRHTVTDFRTRTGRSRYYVIAANPVLDPVTYDSLLSSMRILE